MTVQTFKMKFLGKSGVLFRVLDKNGEVVQVFETKEEAEQFVNAV